MSSMEISEESKSAILSNLQIAEQVKNGDIIIEPFHPKQLGNCSYDVRIGKNYYSSADSKSKILNPWDAESISKFWGEPKTAKVQSFEENDFGIGFGEEYIVLQPGELILGHTIEFIGSVHNSTTMLKGRSTMGRTGISICKDAGWGDTGYFDRWTLEIENHNKIPVVLQVGQKVGQIIFMTCGATDRQYTERGSYQKSSSIEELIEDWEPSNMLPKANVYEVEEEYKDVEISQQTIYM
jgi:dCTP deaminase